LFNEDDPFKYEDDPEDGAVSRKKRRGAMSTGGIALDSGPSEAKFAGQRRMGMSVNAAFPLAHRAIEKESRERRTGDILKQVKRILRASNTGLSPSLTKAYTEQARPHLLSLQQKLKKISCSQVYAAMLVHRVLSEGGVHITDYKVVARAADVSLKRLYRCIKRHSSCAPHVSPCALTEDLKTVISQHAFAYLSLAAGVHMIDDNDRKRLRLQLDLVFRDMQPTTDHPRGKITNSPTVIAAAAVFCALQHYKRSGLRFTQSNVAHATGNSTAAVSKCIASMTSLPALLV